MSKTDKILTYISICLLIIAGVLFGRNILLNHLPSKVSKENCALHNIYKDPVPLALNSNNGEVSYLRIYPRGGKPNPNSDDYGVVMTGGNPYLGIKIFSQPDLGIADCSFSHRYFEKYSHSLAREYFCDECLAAIERAGKTTNLYILNNVSGTEAELHPYTELENGFDLMGYHFEHYETDGIPDYEFRMTDLNFKG